MMGCTHEQARHAVQAWSQRAKAGMNKRASSGESMEPGDGQPGSPRGEHRSHSISSKALHHGRDSVPQRDAAAAGEGWMQGPLKISEQLLTESIARCSCAHLHAASYLIRLQLQQVR